MSARVKPSLARLPQFRTVEVGLEAQRRSTSNAAADPEVSFALPAEAPATEHLAADRMQILVATANGLEMKCFQYCKR